MESTVLTELREWLDDVGLAAWAPVLDTTLADPEKASYLAHELSFPSVWEDRVRHDRRLDLQLVDVLPAADWASTPLTPADTRVLARALHQWTGLPVRVRLSSVTVDYTRWKVTERSGFVSYTPGIWTPEGVDPALPWLVTYAGQRDPAGRRVIVSASGGLVDKGAWLGNTARPIDDHNVSLYAHELLHALGHLHHYAPGLYAPGADRRDGRPWLVSTDCIMASGYVGGEAHPEDKPTEGVIADGDGTPKMAPLLCPICRFRLHPRPARRWARDYLRRALFRSAWDPPLPAPAD